MDLLAAQILAIFIIVAMSFAIGSVPIIIGHKLKLTSEKRGGEANVKAQILAFLMNFGGGVLIGLSLCHWLPETREAMESFNFDTDLAVTEILMVTGFYFICGLDVVLQKVFGPHMHGHSHNHDDMQQKEQIEMKGVVVKTDSGNAMEVSANGNKTGVNSKTNLIVDPSQTFEDKEKKMVSALRTFFVVFALSFHAVMDGVALSLQEDVSSVWISFGAISLHKFVIALSIGIEMMSVGVDRLNSFVSMAVFAGAPALGFAIGHFIYDSTEHGSSSLAVQIIMALATGTILYVVFFEILPKAKDIGATGFQQVLAMVVGFGVFLPTLLLHAPHHHEEE